MPKPNQTLGEFIIENQADFPGSSGELSRLINSIRLAAKVVNHEVNKAGLVDIIGAYGERNVQGEEQQKLDVMANKKFIQTLTNREIVCGIASEEEDDFIRIEGHNGDDKNKYVLLMDPLDGSSNIDVNVSVGTIFRSTSVSRPLAHRFKWKISYNPGINRLPRVILSTELPPCWSTPPAMGLTVLPLTRHSAAGTFRIPT